MSWHNCDALRDLVPFVQFKKRENTHGGVLILGGMFFTFFKLYKWNQIAQRTTVKSPFNYIQLS